MERYGRLADMDRSFDIAYWQRLGPHAIFEAAWQMVVDVHSRRSGEAPSRVVPAVFALLRTLVPGNQNAFTRV
jgi:hypothetical protein